VEFVPNCAINRKVATLANLPFYNAIVEKSPNGSWAEKTYISAAKYQFSYLNKY
jgi:hypothetical protein